MATYNTGSGMTVAPPSYSLPPVLPPSGPSKTGSAAMGALAGLPGGPIGAAIGAATGLGSALIGKHASNKATDAQSAATTAAMANEQANLAEQKRQFDVQQAAAKAEYERQVAIDDAARARRAPYQAMSAGIAQQTAQRLGLGNLGRYGTTPSAVASPGAQLAVTGGIPAVTLGSLGKYAALPADATEEEPPRRTFATLANWNNWSR